MAGLINGPFKAFTKVEPGLIIVYDNNVVTDINTPWGFVDDKYCISMPFNIIVISYNCIIRQM